MSDTPQVNKLEETDEKGAEQKPSSSTPEPASPKPARAELPANIIFIGTRIRNGEEERLTEAPLNLISGPLEFGDLPSSEEQLEGFYYPQAAELCRAFPGLYKPLVKKGE